MKELYQKGWSQERIRSLFRFIDWWPALPQELEEQFTDELAQFEEENKMPYVTSIERQGIKKGLEQGLEQGLEEGREEGHRRGLVEGVESVLEIRFGTEAASIMTQIHQLSNVAVLEKVLQQAKTVDRPENLADLWTGKSEVLRSFASFALNVIMPSGSIAYLIATVSLGSHRDNELRPMPQSPARVAYLTAGHSREEAT